MGFDSLINHPDSHTTPRDFASQFPRWTRLASRFDGFLTPVVQCKTLGQGGESDCRVNAEARCHYGGIL